MKSIFIIDHVINFFKLKCKQFDGSSFSNAGIHCCIHNKIKLPVFGVLLQLSSFFITTDVVQLCCLYVSASASVKFGIVTYDFGTQKQQPDSFLFFSVTGSLSVYEACEVWFGDTEALLKV